MLRADATRGLIRAYACAMRILIVEDEPKTAAYLRKGLGENGFMPMSPPMATMACIWL